VRSLLNNIGGILFLLLFLTILIYLPDIISSITDRGFGEVGQKINSFLSGHGSQVQSRHTQGTFREEETSQGRRMQEHDEVKEDESFSRFYITPHPLSENKNGGEGPFDDFYY